MTRILKIAKRILIWFFILSAGSVILLRFVPVYFTPLMGIRCAQQAFSGEKLKLKHKWIPLEEMSPKMPMAVIASEDNRFPDHHGFDLIEINKAIKERERGRHRGASTISQQTAKNVFLWPGRTWLRKGLEAYFTALIELMWSKQRIMEVYLNSIEMGDGIYGASAVAEWHFGCSAKDLTKGQSALIAATLPNPIRYDSSNPSRYMQKRKKQILHQMKFVKQLPPEGKDNDN